MHFDKLVAGNEKESELLFQLDDHSGKKVKCVKELVITTTPLNKLLTQGASLQVREDCIKVRLIILRSRGFTILEVAMFSLCHSMFFLEIIYSEGSE
jgi:hypothetical protein